MVVDSSPVKLKIEPEKEDPISVLRNVASNDPNLALVGFRIEIEKRLLELAQKYGIEFRKRPLGQTVRRLQEKEVLSSSVASGLSDLIALGNQAAHGARVAPEGVDWLMDQGRAVLIDLDDLIKSS
jgi:hypothetical protein